MGKRQRSVCLMLLIWLGLSPALCRASNEELLEPASWKGICSGGTAFYPLCAITPEQFRLALSNYKQHPDNESYCFQVGGYYARHNSKLLPQFCNEALKRHPSWAAPHFCLGNFHEVNLEDDQAVAEYKKVIQTVPCMGWTLMQLSSLLCTMGEHEDTVATCEDGIKHCHNNSSTSMQLRFYLFKAQGKSLIKLKRAKEAGEALEKAKALPLGRNDKGVRDLLCDSYVASSQWSKVIVNADESIKLGPKKPDAYLARAQAYAALNKNQQALEDISTYLSKFSLTVTPGLQRAHELKAALYERLGKKDLAQRERQSLKGGLKEFYSDTPFQSAAGKGKRN